MFFIELAELLGCVLIFILFVTQIIVPIWQGENLFPLCRKKLKAVDKEMAQVKEEIELAEAKAKLEALKKTLGKEEKNESETDRS